MSLRRTATIGVLALAVSAAAVVAVHAQAAPGAETFTATATVKTAGGASATAPVTIVVSRKMSQSEADRLLAAFKTGGAPALRKALVGVPPTGSVRLGTAAPTETRLTLERPTDKGRLLTIVSDQPILFLGAGVPGAKPKEGYDFAVIDLVVEASGHGAGTLAPAARIKVAEGAFVVGDYAAEVIRLTDLKKAK